MKILLIDPPFHRFMGFYRFFFPFSLASLSAYLNKNRHEVLIYDVDHGDKPVSMTSSDLLQVFPRYLEGYQNPDHPIWDEVEGVLMDFKPDLVGITFMSTKTGSVERIIDISKKTLPHVPVIVGGDHPSELPESTLKKMKADFAVIGEGEATFAELVDEIEAGTGGFEKIRGLAFRAADGRIIATPPRPLIKNLDSLPFPDRESLKNLESYRPDDLSMIMTSRGCPFNCTFCSSIWERRVRNRSVPNIISEIEHLMDRFKTKNIYFKDDTFTVNRKRISEFCRTLRERNICVDWECLTRIELLDQKLLSEMQEAGLVYLKIGIETGSPRLLKETNKNLTIEQIKRGATILNDAGQKWSAFFMIGYPDETEEEIFMSWRLIEEIKPTYVSMSILVPYPGCQYYYDLDKAGAIGEDSDWNLYDPYSLATHFTQNISRDKFRELAVKTMKFVDDYNSSRADIPAIRD